MLWWQGTEYTVSSLYPSVVLLKFKILRRRLRNFPARVIQTCAPYFRAFLIVYQNYRARNSNSVLFLPHLGLGDLIISLPIFRFYSSLGIDVQVLVPDKHLKFLKIFLEDVPVKLCPIEHTLPQFYSSRSQVFQSIKYAKSINSMPIILGYDLIPFIVRLRPGIDHNSIFYMMARVPESARDFVDFENFLRKAGSQIEIPKSTYALIDHFPGTLREINAQRLNSISSRGLELVFNPRDVPYENMLDLIINAEELHLVNSSLLCLCLFLPTNAKSKHIYLIKEGLYQNGGFYPASWIEWAPNLEGGDTSQFYKKLDPPEVGKKQGWGPLWLYRDFILSLVVGTIRGVSD